MRNRFVNALLIQQGACNPSGIALTLHEACKECIAQGVDQRTDPAVRLITHQLAFLMNTQQIESELTIYSQLTRECEDRK
ncbi:hypothetical protein [Mesorhizobium sp.]|uniref:hypothetical protein n=1 Tax=Mesorhizobium sp. TaxID=1871066 RepID=UPI000FE6CCA0|nr:hypothetical protein [Mesorhizobium sp.]RWN60189.1 MAG: hypothetical protein EOS00_16735 [Mesorhizobium sp.]